MKGKRKKCIKTLKFFFGQINFIFLVNRYLFFFFGSKDIFYFNVGVGVHTSWPTTTTTGYFLFVFWSTQRANVIKPSAVDCLPSFSSSVYG